MAQPVRIARPKLLVVEGWNERAFYYALLRCLRIEDVQIQTPAGASEFSPFVEALRGYEGFGRMVSLGLIRDADANPSAAFDSLCEAVRRADLAPPERPGVFTVTRPRVGIFLQPGAGQQGMLETLLLETVKNDAAFKCVEPFLDCVRKTAPSPPRNEAKARAQAFLASREHAGLSIGLAAEKGYWNFDHPVYDELKSFLQAL